MCERGGGVPGLDLLAEDELDVVCVGLFRGGGGGEEGVVEGQELFSAEGADIVEVELDGVESL